MSAPKKSSRTTKALSSVLFGLCVAGVSSEMQYQSFQSRPISLKSGQVANTPTDWGPLEWIEGPAVVREFHAEMSDCSGISVPLDELYVHHWVLYDGVTQGGLCLGTGLMDSVFGIGAEIRGTHYKYAEPYGLVMTGEEVWTGQIHIIRTTNVPDVQLCIECHCSDSVLPDDPHGSVGCCRDGAQCWGMEDYEKDDAKDYCLEYTIGWESLEDTGPVIPLTQFALDVTATKSSDCKIEYDVPGMAANETHTLQSFSDIPSDWNVTDIQIHQHVGGVGLTVDHFRDGKNLGVVCHSQPVYGTGTEAGNEKGYLVKMPACSFGASPYRLLKGDQVRLTSVYGPIGIPGGHPWHEGVMGIVFLSASADPIPSEECLTKLHDLCGLPPYSHVSTCLDCAEKNSGTLLTAQCNNDMLTNECDKTTENNNVPAPDTVPSITLSVTPLSLGVRLNMTGPIGVWFGVGLASSELMDGSYAYLYGQDAESPSPDKTALVHRVLGNHNPGTLVNIDVPASVTTSDGQVSVVFDVDVSVGDGVCYLFAKGDDMSINYHGSTRGSTCVAPL